MPANPKREAHPDFSAYYLQRATQELADDLEKVRTAEDFKADSVPALVHALQQGAVQFSVEDQKRLVAGLGRAGKA
ncbi:hypothetical protein S7711_05418 [Stachybotrys chartarum IBT 7711]|uniref:Ribosome assembly protein 3 n=1 Tax=Stachybotrys chartarum (strain CBS 109288 / IBT 7711) TaxID=1280523 RepID=A0A084AHI9_STACB|nr:hypothetical protein S7711_05418 [Stachybotrys chartarum IBT 7711]KFA45880.1 hypothetical protein S40293_09500 [Stachybotrys chartarum IBT 40293]KFA79140.1 hypothetical protein S40288_05711 [Stachybotrys chartarum IBT 40288]